MQLSKAFDPTALITALKTAGIADAEKLVNADVLPTFFDWLNSSVSMEVGPYAVIVTGVLTELETKAVAALTAIEGAA